MSAAGPGGEGTGPVRARLRRIARVEPGETRALFWSAAYFFFLLFGYYVLRPVRDSFGAGERQNLTRLFLGTLGGTLLANPLFCALVARFPRAVFIPLVYRFFATNLLLFALLFASPSEAIRTWAGRAFWVWLSVFNMFVVSVFWGFMADLFRSGQGKRLFALIAAGGNLGAIAGAALAAGLAERIEASFLLLLAAALLEACVLCVRRLGRIFGLGEGPGARAPDVAEEGREGAGRLSARDLLAGIRLLARSRYLLGISLFILFATVGATFVYFQQAGIAREAFPDPGARTAFFARIDFYVNLLTGAFGLLLTGGLLTRLGVGPTLAIFPVLTTATGVLLAYFPAAGVLTAIQSLRRGAEYGIARPAREVLFTVVRREEKYVSKNFIDTFVVRAGDVIGAGIGDLLPRIGATETSAALALLPVGVLWAFLALALGRRQNALARRVEGIPAETASPIP